MLVRQVNSPLASSCGRLFDAAAAALGICRAHAAYEGQGAVELEALVDHDVLRFEDDELGYPFGIPRLKGRSEERRVGKECRSLCDWSSDVCSSDLCWSGR